jgi:hypothetical protein
LDCIDRLPAYATNEELQHALKLASATFVTADNILSRTLASRSRHEQSEEVLSAGFPRDQAERNTGQVNGNSHPDLLDQVDPNLFCQILVAFTF